MLESFDQNSGSNKSRAETAWIKVWASNTPPGASVRFSCEPLEDTKSAIFEALTNFRAQEEKLFATLGKKYSTAEEKFSGSAERPSTVEDVPAGLTRTPSTVEGSFAGPA